MLVPDAPETNSCCEFHPCRTLEPGMSSKPVGDSLKALDFQGRSPIECVCPLFSSYTNRTKQKPLPVWERCSLWQRLCFCGQRKQRYFYITIPAGTDRLSSPSILTLVTWKFILSNCLFCYEHTHNVNIILSNVAISYFQTQALLSFPMSCYAFMLH